MKHLASISSATGSGTSPSPQQRRVLDFEVWVSTLLRGGVVLCLLLLGVGTVLTFVHHPEYRAQTEAMKHLVTPVAAFPRSLPELKEALMAGQGRGFSTLGLLVLIATPILRVAVSALAFYVERDRAFVVMTLTVLALLLLSLFLGRVGG